MRMYTVWTSKSMPERGYDWSNQGVNEKCLIRENGDYIGLETGKVYEKENFHHSKQFRAKIVAVENDNNTGIYHLDKDFRKHFGYEKIDKSISNRLEQLDIETSENNKYSWKIKYIGCYVTIEKAHFYGNVEVYRCKELGDYWTSNEIEIIEEIKD